MSTTTHTGRAASPYPGLRSFEAHESHLFFGRDEQSDELLRRLSHHRFLAIVGTSGCGKSSLVKAGLLPNLQGGGIVTAGSAWRIATLRPGADPIGNLAAALNAPDVFGTDADADGDLPATTFTEAALRRGPLGLVDVTRQVRLAPRENLLILVDQFEEIFRFAPLSAATRRDDAAAFVKLLLEAAASKDQPIYVVLTMRSDFIGDCARFRGLPEAINDGQYLVPRLTRSQLREAIEGPAAVGGASVSPPLVQALLSEVGDDQDRLPVLQHALMRTWMLRSSEDTLDLSSYLATGGMAHALSRHADEAYGELTPREQEIARRLFRRLTQGRASGRGTRRPSRLGEVSEVVEAPLDDVIRVVEVFRRADRSFLMPPHGVPLTAESTLDISHESLMRQWGRLKEWTRKEYESAAQYRRLSEAAALNAQGRAGLWRRPELDIALGWKAEQRPTAAWASRYNAEFERAMAFLARSVARRRLRSGLWAAGVAALVFMVGAVAYVAHQRGAQNSLRVQMAGSIGDPLTRALLLAELGDVARPDHLRLYRDAAAAAIPVAVVERAGDEAWIGSVFTDGGRRVARVSRGGVISMRSADGRGVSSTVALHIPEGAGPEGALTAADTEDIEGISVTADGRWLGAFSASTLYLADLTTAGPAKVMPVDGEAPVTDLSWAGDGSKLAAARMDGSLWIWDMDRSGNVAREGPGPVLSASQRGFDPVERLQFDADGRRLAVGTFGGIVQVAHLDGRYPDVLLDGATERYDSAGDRTTLRSLAFSPDGNWLACGYSDAVVRIWNSRTPGAPLLLQGHHGPVLALAFSSVSEGSHLKIATGSEDASARVWALRVRSGTGQETADAATALQIEGPPMLLAGHDGSVTHVVFSPSGAQIATTSDDGTTRLWRQDPLEPLVVGQHDREVDSIAFNHDGTLLVTSSRDRTARVWHVDGSAAPIVLEGHTGWVRAAVFSPVEPSTIVTASEDGTLRVWSAATSREVNQWSPSSPWTPLRLLAVAFSPDGTRLAVGAADNNARILDMAQLGEPTVLQGHQDWVFDVAFDRDGTRVLTAGGDGTAALWSLSGERRQAIDVQGDSVRPDRRVLAAAFSPDGTKVATASAENVAIVWDVQSASGQLPKREPWEIRHSSAVNDVAFDPQGRSLLTASSDRTARLSEVRTGREIITFPHPAPVRTAAFHPGGQRIVTGAADGVVRLWRTALEELVTVLRNATTACLAPSERAAFLGEAPSKAEAAYQACERSAERLTRARRGPKD